MHERCFGWACENINKAMSKSTLLISVKRLRLNLRLRSFQVRIGHDSWRIQVAGIHDRSGRIPEGTSVHYKFEHIRTLFGLLDFNFLRTEGRDSLLCCPNPDSEDPDSNLGIEIRLKIPFWSGSEGILDHTN